MSVGFTVKREEGCKTQIGDPFDAARKLEVLRHREETVGESVLKLLLSGVVGVSRLGRRWFIDGRVELQTRKFGFCSYNPGGSLTVLDLESKVHEIGRTGWCVVWTDTEQQSTNVMGKRSVSKHKIPIFH